MQISSPLLHDFKLQKVEKKPSLEHKQFFMLQWILKYLKDASFRRPKSKHARCLKITEKISFNIASEASYVYILSGQKLIKNAKNSPFWRVF